MTPANDNRPAEFDALLVMYLPGLRSLARRYGLDADDASQAVAVKAMENWYKYRPEGGFYGWLRGLMRNYAASSSAEHVSYDIEIEISVEEEPGNLIDLYKTLSRIPPDRVDIIVDYADGESAASIADRFGVSAQAMNTFIAETLEDIRNGGHFRRAVPQPVPVVVRPKRRVKKDAAYWLAIGRQVQAAA